MISIRNVVQGIQNVRQCTSDLLLIAVGNIEITKLDNSRDDCFEFVDILVLIVADFRHFDTTIKPIEQLPDALFQVHKPSRKGAELC